MSQLFLLTWFAVLCIPCLGAPGDWQRFVPSLLSESGRQRDSALESLRRYPGIEAALREAVRSGEGRTAALEVIGALKLVSITPDLIQTAKVQPRTDLFVTLNTLIAEGAESPGLANFYREQLIRRNEATPAGAVLAMLDGLRSMGGELDVPVLEGLIVDSNSQIRLGTLHYAAKFLKQEKRPEYLSILISALAATPHQVRLEAAMLLDSIPHGRKQAVRLAAQRCLNDAYPEVKAACRRLMERRRAGE